MWLCHVVRRCVETTSPQWCRLWGSKGHRFESTWDQVPLANNVTTCAYCVLCFFSTLVPYKHPNICKLLGPRSLLLAANISSMKLLTTRSVDRLLWSIRSWLLVTDTGVEFSRCLFLVLSAPQAKCNLVPFYQREDSHPYSWISLKLCNSHQNYLDG